MMKVAVVTGATKGIGKAIVLKLASLKFALVIVGRNKIQLEALKATIEKSGTRCLALTLDLLDDATPEKIVCKTMEQFGQMDVLVNNAGVAHAAPISETDIESWNNIFTINARAPFFLCKAAVSKMVKSENPIIINIGSVVGFKGYKGQAAYASSKHALAGFTKVLAKEVQKDGIKVHLISPGGVNTEMVQHMRPDINTEELIQPEEIAELVSFLVSRKGTGTIDHLYIRRQTGLAFD